MSNPRPYALLFAASVLLPVHLSSQVVTATATTTVKTVANVTTGTLLREMVDLGALARMPAPAYKLPQFSSYDRRSKGAEDPDWFSNADGFGGEPIPGFEAVLREPVKKDAPGLYRLARIQGPGAIVRGWSAGMAGVLRVYLDGETEAHKIYEGEAYDFLARRSQHFLAKAGVEVEADDAFVQQDADYLPIPFAKSLLVTWEGNIQKLHFYHLQVRVYEKATKVVSFDPKADLRRHEVQLRQTVAGLLQPGTAAPKPQIQADFVLEPGQAAHKDYAPHDGGGAIDWLRIKIEGKAGELAKLLRGTVLQIAFDGSQRPQVEAPVGDFFGSGPGINPLECLPFSVTPDGVMTCRFVMPFARSFRLGMQNHSGQEVRGKVQVHHRAQAFDARSLYFRARWRADHGLSAQGRKAPQDLAYVMLQGRGRLVGVACMVVNPSPGPTAGGNWWGEGDEKIFVDGERRPSTFGTGSEDYYNYSWSRSALFDHPYCGQPLDSGPDTAGYVSNHRLQILDAIPFQTQLAFFMELWTHNPVDDLSYARLAYVYARPGAVDDHRRPKPGDLRVPALPQFAPKALGAASGATFHYPEELQPKLSGGDHGLRTLGLASRGRIWSWQASVGQRLVLQVPNPKEGTKRIHLVALHSPRGASFVTTLDGEPLLLQNGDKEARLYSPHQLRVLNVHFRPRKMTAGTHDLVLECTGAGELGIDYLWVRPERR